jgi:hypothetical protein
VRCELIRFVWILCWIYVVFDVSVHNCGPLIW